MFPENLLLTAMYILSLNATYIGILALLVGAVILGTAVYFFQSSRRSLQKVLDTNKEAPPKYSFDEIARPPIKEHAPRTVVQQPLKRQQVEEEVVYSPKATRNGRAERGAEENIHSLKEIIAEQQKLLTSLLERAEESEHSKLAEEKEELEQKITDMELKLEERDQQISSLTHRVTAAQKMTERIEEVYREFEALQSRLTDLEVQAGKATKLEMELADQYEGYEQLKKDLIRKQTKLEETFSENQRLQMQLNEVEDKLAEANLQRQQLNKKVQFLQEMNSDLQHMSESHKKLQTELRRIGELESMLHMIAEERDLLLRKKDK